MNSRSLHALTAATLLLLSACGGAEQGAESSRGKLIPRVPLDSAALNSDNGMSTNGMSTNGVSTNGMSTNGMSTNGLALNGLVLASLSSDSFRAWFGNNPSYADMVMQYVAKCALPAGAELAHSHLSVKYHWQGELGLAPIWASGAAIPWFEQQLISACLGAHANKYGVHMAVSIRGYQESWDPIPISSTEAQQYSVDEGCFFGNLFDGTGVFSGYSANSPMVQGGKTSLRACALTDGKLGDCSPIVSTGRSCQSLCTGNSDAAGNFEYLYCTWKGVTYKPITTRLMPTEIASCGNGVCEASESCYNLWNHTGCSDCGVCW